MELFELKYTEDIHELYLKIQSLLNHYLIEHNKIETTDIYDIINNNTEIIDEIYEDTDDDILQDYDIY